MNAIKADSVILWLKFELNFFLDAALPPIQPYDFLPEKTFISNKKIEFKLESQNQLVYSALMALYFFTKQKKRKLGRIFNFQFLEIGDFLLLNPLHWNFLLFDLSP